MTKTTQKLAVDTCINPDVSLAELIEIRAGYDRKLDLELFKKDNDFNTVLGLAAMLAKYDRKIESLENAAGTGGIIRLI